LLDGRIEWTPGRDEGLYQFRGRVKIDQLFEELVPSGFPQGGSSPMPASWNQIAGWVSRSRTGAGGLSTCRSSVLGINRAVNTQQPAVSHAP